MDKITLEFDAERDTIGVTTSKGVLKETFRISEDGFRNMFTGRYSTGWLGVSQDGPVYIEEKDGVRIVIMQRGLRPDQQIEWNDHRAVVKKTLTAPWCFFGFKLTPQNGGFRKDREYLAVSSGPCRGPMTPLHSAQFLGNIFNYDLKTRLASTNICWGNTAVAPGGIVSMASLLNITGDFFTQQFTNHIERTTERWEEFSRTTRLPSPSFGTLQDLVNKLWE